MYKIKLWYITHHGGERWIITHPHGYGIGPYHSWQDAYDACWYFYAGSVA